MKKFRLFVFALVVTLFLSVSNAAFASNTEFNTGNLGVFNVRDSDAAPHDEIWGTEVQAVTGGKDSIVSITVRYKLLYSIYYSTGNVHIEMVKQGANMETVNLPSVPVTYGSWTAPVTYNISDCGYSTFIIDGLSPRFSTGNIAQVEVINVKYRRYSLDGTSLSIGSDGYVHVSITNSTPNDTILYNIKNNITNSYESIYNLSTTDSWIDTSIGNSKTYSYTLEWGFSPYYYTYTVDLGSIFVPVDWDLTNRVNTVISDVSNGNGNTITAVRDASGTVLSEARQAKTNSQNASTNALNAYNTAQTVNTKIDALSTAVTNIQNNMGVDTSPPVVNLTTVSGARATSGNSINIVVGVSDNISNTFTYSLNDSTYQPLPADRIVTVPVNGFGAVPINVWVKDEAGNKGTGFIAIRKL